MFVELSRNQRTILQKAQCGGIGIHSGNYTKMKFLPALADYGIRFVRVDINPQVEIPAYIDYVTDTNNNVTIGKDGLEVKTVEHVLAALRGLEVDNCLIEIDSNEAPTMDGSSRDFIHLIETAGIRDLPKKALAICITHPIWIYENNKYLIALPSQSFDIDYSIYFDNPMIGFQNRMISLSPYTFKKEIAHARTFGFMHEVEMLRQKGLIKGGSYDNALVFDSNGILSAPLRYSDEPVRHKILDLIGDLSLIGLPMQGLFISKKGGHKVDIQLVKKIKQNLFQNFSIPSYYQSLSPITKNIA